jgi:EAL domain-containing protein (putative c-di-GMP-specific phosphodiesterase class I)
VTGTQIAESGFADRVLATVASHGLQPANIVIEVTETLLIEEGDQVIATLDILRQAGMIIALDDFGTGFSSLNHVRDFPVKLLKIDRSYTSRITTCSATRAIVDTVHELANKLDLRVVIEGIETTEERDLLLEMGLEYGQGYLMARPCDEETFLSEYAPSILVTPLN